MSLYSGKTNTLIATVDETRKITFHARIYRKFKTD